MNVKERRTLERIIHYCNEIAETQKQLGNDPVSFANSFIYQNACAMCVIQIGELANRLSDETRAAIPNIPWRLIRAMRNTFAHDYGSMDVLQTWATLCDDIPVLKAACEHYLDRLRPADPPARP